MSRIGKEDPGKDFTEDALMLELEAALVDPEGHKERQALNLDKSPEALTEHFINKVSNEMLDKVDTYLKESEMFNLKNPRSLFALLPHGLGEILFNTMKKNPALLETYILRDDVKFERLTKPTITDHLIRMSFWNEYYRAQNQGDKMQVRNIYEAVCPRENFYQLVQRPHRVMWMLTPPEDQAKQMEVLLAKGMRRLDEILSLPITQNGKINIAVANLIMKTAIVLDVRLKGQAVQKLEVTNKHEHNLNMTQEQVEKKIRELEKEEAEIKTISVNPAPDKRQAFHSGIGELKEFDKY